MNRKIIYEKTENFMKGRWASIVFVNIMIGIVLFGIVEIISQIFFKEVLVAANLMLRSEDVEVIAQGLSHVSGVFSIILPFASIITGIIAAGLSMEILEAYRTDGRVSIGGVFSKMFKNFSAILLSIVLLAFLNFVLVNIPYIGAVGAIVSIIISYAVAFSVFVIADDSSKNGFEALTVSAQETKGHKLDLFMMAINYALKPLAGLLVMIIGVLVSVISVGLAQIIIGIGSMLIFVLGIKYIPYVAASKAIYYDEIKENQKIKTEVVEPEVIG